MLKFKDIVIEAKKQAWIFVKEEDENIEKPEVEEEAKANEVMNTGATNFWAELIPTDVVADPLLDMLGNYSKLLPLLPGDHGNNMAVSERVPIIGEADLFEWNSEWTTGAWTLTPGDHGPDTDKVMITQWQFITTVDISKRELRYATDRLEAIVRERINRAAARTIDAVIINADDTASGSGNINWTYSWSPYFVQQDNGIRKVGIANTGVNVWTITAWQYLAVKNVLDTRYQWELKDLLFIEPSNVYNKTLLLSEVITADKFGPNATISAGVLAKIFSIDILVARDWPALTNTSGLVDATAWNNTKGSFACVYKPAIQYWFWQPLEIEVGKVLWKWVKIVATMEFWFAIANEKAWLWKTVWLWINATV